MRVLQHIDPDKIKILPAEDGQTYFISNHLIFRYILRSMGKTALKRIEGYLKEHRVRVPASWNLHDILRRYYPILIHRDDISIFHFIKNFKNYRLLMSEIKSSKVEQVVEQWP